MLDLLAPVGVMDAAAGALRPAGSCALRRDDDPAVPSWSRRLRLHSGFTEPQAGESMVRDWHVEGLAVRPGHKMMGHTAFWSPRRMAPGERPTRKRRRPAPGAYGPDYSGRVRRVSPSSSPSSPGGCRLVTIRRFPSRFPRLVTKPQTYQIGTAHTPTRVQIVTNSAISVGLSWVRTGRVEIRR